MANLLNLIPKRENFFANDIFDRFFNESYPLSTLKGNDDWVPAFDISENEKEYIVTAELPGMEVKDIDVTLSDGILTVKGEKNRSMKTRVRIITGLKGDMGHLTGASGYLERSRQKEWTQIIKREFSD